MIKNSFYIDSCIYLNLWQKEGDETKGIPYWMIAKIFLEKFDNEESILYYSGFILKELKFTLSKEEFMKKERLFKESPNFKKLILSKEEFEIARKIELEIKYEISFFDIIHTLLAKKSNSILITRDKKLLEVAKKYLINAKRPEEIL